MEMRFQNEVKEENREKTPLEKLIEQSDAILDKLVCGEIDEKVEPIEDKEYFKDESKEYDPDSSPVAWMYYEKMYNFIDKNKKMDNTGNPRRIKGLWNYNDDFGWEHIDYGDLKDNTIAIAGDCVFNFKKEYGNDNVLKSTCKYSKFRKKICACKVGKGKECDRRVLLSKIELCSRMHHSPYNFALMPITGGMNNAKDKSGQAYDRIDCFLYGMNEMYKIAFETRKTLEKSQKDKYAIIWNTKQKSFLSKFLQTIGSVEKYAKIFYHLDGSRPLDKILLYAMIGFGSHEIETPEDVDYYMNMAILYWSIQRCKYYEKVDDENKKEKQKQARTMLSNALVGYLESYKEKMESDEQKCQNIES